jgi:hypothetical protein
MKKLFLLFTASLALAAVYAQNISSSKVPHAVTSAFKTQHPNIKNVSWEMENGGYEANFKMNGTNSSATYDEKGSLLESEADIKVSQLPAGASEYVKGHYKSPIKEASKITKANGEVNYEAMVNHTDVIFDSNGKFLKETKEEKEDKDDKAKKH